MSAQLLPADSEGADPSLWLKAKALRLLVFDFDGVFTDNKVYVSQDGSEQVCCSRADGLGLRLVESVDVTPIILSTEKNPVVLRRAEKLKIEARNGLDDKELALREEVRKRALTMQEVWYVGNDINDMGCLQSAGLAIIVADAHKAVFPHAHYVTNLAGGQGAVREICDLVYALRAQTKQEPLT